MSSLSDATIRSARPKEKTYKLFDGGGLYLMVTPSGGKWWRLKFYHGGKESSISLGTYPSTGLKDARAKRDEAKKLLAAGIDPGAQRKALKVARTGANSLAAVAREWHEKFSPRWTPDHAAKVLGFFEKGVFPWLGSKPVQEVTAPELLVCLRRIESRGAPIIARRGLADLSRVFRYAIHTSRATRDPAVDLRGALSPTKEKHHAAITDAKLVGALLRSIDGYQGSFVTQCALKLAPLVFLRPGELRKAEWREIDIDAAEWRIPAARMKMRQAHIVPLSRQAVAILREIHPLTGSGRYTFPGAYRRERPLSTNTLTAALRRLGFEKGEMTSHGFRGLASTLLHEMGYPSDMIERQLAHADRDKVRAAYSHAQYLPERRKMMQAWADFLCGLKLERPRYNSPEATVTATDLLVLE